MNRHVATLFILLACIANAYSQGKRSAILTPGAPEWGGFSAVRLARLDSGMSDWVKEKWINGSVAFHSPQG